MFYSILDTQLSNVTCHQIGQIRPIIAIEWGKELQRTNWPIFTGPPAGVEKRGGRDLTNSQGSLREFILNQSRFWLKGMRRSTFQWKKVFFSVKRGEAIQWMRGLVRISKRQFSEEVRAIQWTAGLWKFKSCCPHPLPENQLLLNCAHLRWSARGSVKGGFQTVVRVLVRRAKSHTPFQT